MAVCITQQYKNVIEKQRRRKALVIMNSKHGYGLISDKFSKSFLSDYNIGTTARLMKELPGKVANVMMNTGSIQYGALFTPVQHGKWETSFLMAGNPDAGFNFNGSPFGDDKFDLAFFSARGLTYKDVFTGFIGYQPLNKQVKKAGFPHEFTNFEDSILKRAAYVDKSEVEVFKAAISRAKHSNNPVLSENFPFALFSNLIVLVIIPSLLLISFLITLFVFLRSRR